MCLLVGIPTEDYAEEHKTPFHTIAGLAGTNYAFYIPRQTIPEETQTAQAIVAV